MVMYLGLMFYAGRLDKFITFSPKNSQADITALSSRGAVSFAAAALLSWGSRVIRLHSFTRTRNREQVPPTRQEVNGK